MLELPGPPRSAPAGGSPSRRAAAAGLLAIALPAVLYLLTLYPGLGDRSASGDAVEFQYVGRALSIPHEPGYPQYVLLSFLWSWVPLPMTLAAKINLFSAVFAAAAGLFIFLAARDFSGSPTAAIVACWAVLTAPDLWRLATQAEVYTLHVFWVALLFWAALRWQRGAGRAPLILLLFVYALAFGNHLTMIALLPALVFLLLTRQPRLITDGAAWAWAGAAAVIGAAQYLLLVWRSYVPHPSLLRRFPLRAGPAEILAYVTGDRFVEKHWLPAGLSEWLSRAGEALAHGAGQLSYVVSALAIFGLLSAWRRQRSATAFLAIAAGSIVLFAAAYDIRDWLLYCIPAWLAAALFAAQGLARVLEKLPRGRLVVGVALAAVLVLRIAGGIGELRVTGDPADLEKILPKLPEGSHVIPAGGHRLTRLIVDYYRYGVGLEATDRVRFVSAREDMVERLLNLRDRPLYFRSPTVVKIMSGRLIDSRESGWGDEDGPLLVTGTDDPIGEVALRPIDENALELLLREERRTLTDEKALYLLFIGLQEARSKGLEVVEIDEPGWTERVEKMLRVLPEGDAVVLMVPRVRAELVDPLGEILGSAGVAPPPAGTRRFFAVWRHGGDPARARLAADPAATEIVDLAGI